jgi:hypothetical protein
MFEPLRDALRGLSMRLDPDERRAATHAMREALVHAKVGLTDLRELVEATTTRLNAERAELETVRRRQGLAAQIDDHETVAIAERFAVQHQERVGMLETKLMVQQHELSLAEREYEAMEGELRAWRSGVVPPAPDETAIDPLGDLSAAASPRRTRAEREADAEERLAALKRRMGK